MQENIKNLVDLRYSVKLKLMISLLFCLFVTSMNQSIVSIAGPSIVSNLGGFNYYSWVFASFSLTSAIIVPVIGKSNDKYGAKKVILPSLLIFSIATFGCGLSTNILMLIFFRAIQGIGFAGVMATIWIVIASLWKPIERGKWLGITSVGFTTSGVIGPIIGAVINDYIGWRWIFFTNVPLCLIAALSIIFLFPKQNIIDKSKFDLIGITLFGLFASTILLGVSIGAQQNSYLSTNILLLFLISLITLISFIVIEKKVKDPLIPLYLFKSRIFTGGILGSLFIVMSWTVWSVFLPLSLITVSGYSASKASLALIALAIGSAFGANFFGYFISKPKLTLPIAISGFASIGIGMFACGYTNLNIEYNLVIIMAVLVGFGSTGTFTAFTVPIQNNLPENKLAIVTSSLQFSRVFGISMGSALLGAILLMNMTSFNFEFPRSEIYNPDNISSLERINEIKDEYLKEKINLDIFNHDLEISKANLENGLSKVYYAASFCSLIGIIISIFTFKGINRHPPLEEDSKLNG